MPRDDYEERQEARQERLYARAEQQEAEAAARHERADGYFYQMNGQPILVGHHSEKRHRSQIAKAEGNMRKAFELQDKAKHNRSAAASVGSAGIMSDDPEAVVQMRNKIAALETRAAIAKKVNARMRKARKAAGGTGTAADRDPAVIVAGILAAAEMAGELGGNSAATRSELESQFRVFPWPPKLDTRAAVIRDSKKRLKTLEFEAEHANDEPVTTMQGDGWEIIERPDLNRIHLDFGGARLGRELFRAIRGSGFRWSRNDEVFSRHLTNGRWPAFHVTKLPLFVEAFGEHDYDAYPTPYERQPEPPRPVDQIGR